MSKIYEIKTLIYKKRAAHDNIVSEIEDAYLEVIQKWNGLGNTPYYECIFYEASTRDRVATKLKETGFLVEKSSKVSSYNYYVTEYKLRISV